MSTRLGVRDKEDILDDFDKLFGRMYSVMRCPLDKKQLADCHNNLIPKSIRDMANAAAARGYNVTYWTDRVTSFTVPYQGRKLSFRLDSYHSEDGEDETKTFMQNTNRFMKFPGQRANTFDPDISLDAIRAAFGPLSDPFMDWAHNFATMYSKCELGKRVVTEIVEMAGTAGQINRMVPELIGFLPKDKAKALREQKRASSLPYNWATYSRTDVRAALLTMSTCYLMPPTGRSFADTPHERALWAVL